MTGVDGVARAWLNVVYRENIQVSVLLKFRCPVGIYYVDKIKSYLKILMFGTRIDCFPIETFMLSSGQSLLCSFNFNLEHLEQAYYI